jgi:cell division protein FtsW (lipid II flippase)
MAWWIQLVFWFVPGCFVGFLLARRCRHRFWLDEGAVLPWILGAGLILGAIATQKGDRLWMDRVTRFLPPEEYQQSQFSRLCSLLIGIAGVGMMIYALLMTFNVI